MLTFFRTIRKNLLSSGQARKYLLYALGEIGLVVIGILIALQVNNWNEERKDRVKEQEILHDIVQNLEKNIETLEADIDSLFRLNQSAKIIVAVLDQKLPYADSLATHFHYARVHKYGLSLSMSGYEQYRNSGFDIILNDRLKGEVIDYFESTHPKWFNEYSLVNDINLSFTDYYVPLFYYRGENLIPIDMESLYADRYFIGWIRAYMEGRNWLIEHERRFIGETRRVLEVIREEFGEE